MYMEKQRGVGRGRLRKEGVMSLVYKEKRRSIGRVGCGWRWTE